MLWTIFGISAIILLIIFWFAGRRNAVYGGLTLGAILGIFINIYFIFKGSSFNWFIVGKSATCGIIAGFIAELIALIPIVTNRFRKSKSTE